MSYTPSVISEQQFEQLRRMRATQPDGIATALAQRERRELLAGDGRLMIVAADHPARGAVSVGNRPTAMADRYELLDRMALAVSRPGVDGVLGTPDIIDDLAALGLLEGKIVVASTNRGGLRGASFEMDDRMTGYDIPSVVRDRLDFAKTLLRINFEDAGTTNTLVENARIVDAAFAAKVPVMLEPFISKWVDGKICNDLSPDAVILSIAIAASVFGAQAIGAGKNDLLNKVTRTALIMNILFTGSLVVLAYLFSKYLMALFITDPQVVVLGQQLLFIVLWSILFFGASAIFASIMRASGTVTVPMIINIIAIIAIEVPAAYLFSHWWGLQGIWYGYALAFVCLCIMQGLYYQFVWKKKTIEALI